MNILSISYKHDALFSPIESGNAVVVFDAS